MGPRGIAFGFALFFVLSWLVIPGPARAIAPTISNVIWTPWVPAHLENFAIEADIVSPGGPPQVFAPVCTIPAWICVPHEMTDSDGDGRFVTPLIYAPNQTFSGVYFNVTAIDPGGNVSFTERIYVQVASVISVTTILTPSSILPGESVEIRGSADYESNSSVPAKFSTVSFQILETGATWSTVSDGTGAFTSSFTAPTTERSYTLRTTVLNRTISGSTDRYFAVARSPTPDLLVVPGSLGIEPAPTIEGQSVTISVSVENRGTAAAGSFVVQINISRPAGTAVSRDLPVDGLAIGEGQNLSLRWTAIAGGWTVTVRVDPYHKVSELTKDNNQVAGSVDAALKPSETPSAILMGGVALAGVGVAAAVVLAYRWRAGRRKGP